MGKEGKYNLFIRAEFQNIFNRLFLSMRAVGPNVPYLGTGVNPATVPPSNGGVNAGGYGYIATLGGGATAPGSGQIAVLKPVARALVPASVKSARAPILPSQPL